MSRQLISLLLASVSLSACDNSEAYTKKVELHEDVAKIMAKTDNCGLMETSLKTWIDKNSAELDKVRGEKSKDDALVQRFSAALTTIKTGGDTCKLQKQLLAAKL